MNARPEPVVPVLELEGVTKSYGHVRALTRIDLAFHAGTVIGITGDNGAGKSTLLKVIAGAVSPDTGTIRLGGQEVHFDSPTASRLHGIEIVYQELALAPDLDVVQNAFLGRELTRKLFGWLPLGGLDRKRMEADVRQRLHDLNVELHPLDRPMAEFSGGQRQAVAIVRAMTSEPRVVALDEPTAALSAAKIPAVLSLLRRLRDQGVCVLIVSHRIQDLLEVSDRIVVVGGGTVVLDAPAAGLTLRDVVDAVAQPVGED
ncbi:MAG TPA: ATP-binding cassette domain-containing protein [Pseudolysinimonas sp.]|nr:ATP-binding cassette domain-containing protein [Pseudolysinimonas sp.]